MSIRSVLRSRGLRGAAIAGALAAALATAGAPATVLASTAAFHRIDAIVPTEQCATWSGTVDYSPALTTSPQNVTATLTGTLSNCSDFGNSQAGTGSVQATLSGTAAMTSASLTGDLFLTWPASANLVPSVVPITLTGSSGAYSFGGTLIFGAGTVGRGGPGLPLNSSYAAVYWFATDTGTLQDINGTSPVAIYVNEG
jgi:hypothetical protein